MAADRYYQAILDKLQGRTDELRTIPPERLDWAGPGALLELYRKASGRERSSLIRAIGQIIEDQAASPPVLAQLIQIASSLDLAEVEPQVRKLRERAVAADEPLRGAITNYLAFRKLNTSPEVAVPPRPVHGKPRAHKSPPARRGHGKLRKA